MTFRWTVVLLAYILYASQCYITEAASMVRHCGGPMVRFDISTNQTFCYAAMPFNITTYTTYGASLSEFEAMRAMCNDLDLVFDISVKSSLVSIGSAEEETFVTNLILGELQRLPPTGARPISSFLLLGANQSGWVDESSSQYLQTKLPHFSALALGDCVYVDWENGLMDYADLAWSSRACNPLQYYQTANGFSYAVCKAGIAGFYVPVPGVDGGAYIYYGSGSGDNITVIHEPVLRARVTPPPLRDPFYLSRLRYCSDHNTRDEYERTMCYAIIAISASDFSASAANERTVAIDTCSATYVVMLDGTVVGTTLFAMGSTDEEWFVRDQIAVHLAGLDSEDKRDFAGRVVMAAFAYGIVDESADPRFLKQRLDLATLDAATCAFYDFYANTYKTGKCGDRGDYFEGAVSFAICKATEGDWRKSNMKRPVLTKRIESPWAPWRSVD